MQKQPEKPTKANESSKEESISTDKSIKVKSKLDNSKQECWLCKGTDHYAIKHYQIVCPNKDRKEFAETVTKYELIQS